MPISYEKLFKLLEEKNITTYYLKNGKGNLGTESLEKLCKLLSCQPGDLMEYIPEQPHPQEGV